MLISEEWRVFASKSDMPHAGVDAKHNGVLVVV
jgi:hypothetical protein